MPHFNEMVYHSGGMPASGPMSGGNTWWVDSGASLAADSTNNGGSRNLPFATIDYAVGRCTANNGDIIYVCEGHAETKSATGSVLACDVEGISIIGLGEGADRPTITLSHTGAAMTISAANVLWRNLLIVAGIDGVLAPLTISAADCTLDSIEWRDTTDIELVRCLITTAAADRLRILNCLHDGYTAGDASVNFARLVGVNGCLIQNCRFHGNYSTGVIEFHTTLSTKVDILGCVFNDTGTTDLSDNIVATVGSNTYFVDSFDLAAGYHFSGGSGQAVAGDDVGLVSTGVSTAVSFATTSSAAVSGLTSSFVVESGAVSGLTSFATTSSTAVSGLTSSFVVESGAVSGLTSFATTSSTAVSGLTSSFVVESGAVSGLTSFATTSSAAVSGLTSSFVVESGAVSGLTSFATTSSTAVSGLTSSFVVESGAVSGLTSSFAIQSAAVSGLTSSLAIVSITLSTMLSYLVSGW